VAPEQLEAEARAMAVRFADGPTLAYAEAKRAMAVSLEAALKAEGEGQARLGVTEDHRNAVTAFLAKQPPTFNAR
jgi:2-(1,2-epoxy-1,2-dihydrophenyl)acetyl-CoA isomerase